MSDDREQKALGAARATIAARDLLLVVGTSSAVEPAASLPSLRTRDALLVQINPELTGLTGAADVALNGAAGQALPALASTAWPERSGAR